jgi:hypothetical protein
MRQAIRPKRQHKEERRNLTPRKNERRHLQYPKTRLGDQVVSLAEKGCLCSLPQAIASGTHHRPTKSTSRSASHQGLLMCSHQATKGKANGETA